MDEYAVVIDVVVETVEEAPPPFHDQTSLEIEANSKYGMSAKETLSASQELYENGLISYPRTSSHSITSDMVQTVSSMLAVEEDTGSISTEVMLNDTTQQINAEGGSCSAVQEINDTKEKEEEKDISGSSSDYETLFDDLFITVECEDNASDDDGSLQEGSSLDIEDNTNRLIDLKNKTDDAFANYIYDIEQQTGTKIGDEQLEIVIDKWNNGNYSYIGKEATVAHRKKFNNKRKKVLQEWEKKTGKEWPTYTEPLMYNGRQLKETGQTYDAHHIIENSYAGEHEWWNVHPAKFTVEHQKGIHRSGSPCRELFKDE